MALVLSATGVVAAGPAGAASAARIGPVSFHSKPIPLQDGYSAVITGHPNGYFAVAIEKSGETAQQSYFWGFSGLSGHLQPSNEDMNRVKLSASLAGVEGASGNFNMVLKDQRDPVLGPIPGCQGVKYLSRKGGVFKGSFSFDTGTDLFGVISGVELKIARIKRTVGLKTRCQNPWPCESSTTLGISPENTGYDQPLMGVSRVSGNTSFYAHLANFYDSGYYMQKLDQEVDDSAFDPESDISGATATGSGLVTGSVTFAQNEPARTLDDRNCGAYTQSFGQVTGNLTYAFDLAPITAASEGAPVSAWMSNWP